MKEERLKVDKLFPNPFLAGELIFVASKIPKEKVFKIELSDEAKLQQVREQLRAEELAHRAIWELDGEG